ncbi:MAG: hypothetical protein ACYTGV_08840 [Planctomycetota bacterium]|jgi:hypothetical protein
MREKLARPKLVRQVERQDAAEAEFLEDSHTILPLQIRMARNLARIKRTRHYVLGGCSSIAHYGEMNGRSGREALVLAAVGECLELRPDLEERILSGRLSLDGVATLKKLFERPELIREGEDWVRWAEEWSAKELEEAVRRRLREAASGEHVSVLVALLTDSARVRFQRAKQLASRKKNAALSDGQTVDVLSDHYLDSFDPDRRKPRSRRMPDTTGQPGRHLAAETEREVVGRYGDRCAVPRCDHRIWLNRAHIEPHRRGGSREAWNLIYVCWEHHVLYDFGYLRIEGTPDDCRFRTRDGTLLGRIRRNGGNPGPREPPPA